MTLHQLAREGLALLELQKTYFKYRNPTLLDECKAAERRFMKLCKEALGKPANETKPLPGLEVESGWIPD